MKGWQETLNAAGNSAKSFTAELAEQLVQSVTNQVNALTSSEQIKQSGVSHNRKDSDVVDSDDEDTVLLNYVNADKPTPSPIPNNTKLASLAQVEVNSSIQNAEEFIYDFNRPDSIGSDLHNSNIEMIKSVTPIVVDEKADNKARELKLKIDAEALTKAAKDAETKKQVKTAEKKVSGKTTSFASKVKPDGKDGIVFPEFTPNSNRNQSIGKHSSKVLGSPKENSGIMSR